MPPRSNVKTKTIASASPAVVVVKPSAVGAKGRGGRGRASKKKADQFSPPPVLEPQVASPPPVLEPQVAVGGSDDSPSENEEESQVANCPSVAIGLGKRLNRRDSDDKDKRLFEQRFKNDQRWKEVVNKDGQYPMQWAKPRLKKLRKSNQRPAAEFWTLFYQAFPMLAAGRADVDLEAPAQQEDMRSELDSAWAMAYSDNFAIKSVVPLERYWTLHLSQLFFVTLATTSTIATTAIPAGFVDLPT